PGDAPAQETSRRSRPSSENRLFADDPEQPAHKRGGLRLVGQFLYRLPAHPSPSPDSPAGRRPGGGGGSQDTRVLPAISSDNEPENSNRATRSLLPCAASPSRRPHGVALRTV